MRPALFSFILSCLLFSFASAQTLQSPLQFLGYELGTKFTVHSNIVKYFEAAAKASPNIMKLERYGQTYEGRPLMIAIIATPENLSRIEEIRNNNLRLTGLPGNLPATENAPAIVWLSYNVHGNEASSSEVSMKVLYELLNGRNASLNQWMKNTVVIIDPCLNPDGRDRYVNWFTQVSGKFPNADPNARELNEPWPPGRVNHYNFDLNRDWVWQSQKESEERVKKYRQWMPQIHCDFHEMGPNSPYYFAPGAEPVHEAITQWQRDFQVTVGKNHAKYFDEKGWLYFTKEYYDLFYPSYGDTYPFLNGAIGMTYEQGGGERAGLKVLLQNGDTLRLSDRIDHHFTTSLSTIETASLNAQKLVSSFKKFFDDSRAGTQNVFKSYIISKKSYNGLTALKTLLTKNDIRFAYAGESSTIKAFSYASGKEETVKVNRDDIVIPAAQPEGVLLRVLFEPQSKLSDSATYDITAWSLPYAYGLTAFASKDIIPVHQTDGNAVPPQLSGDAYAYIIGMNNFDDTRLLSAILREGIKFHYSEVPFSFNDVKYSAGSIIVLRKENETKRGTLLTLAAQYSNGMTAVSSGFMQSGIDFGSDKVHSFRSPSVAMVTGDGSYYAAAGEVWHLFEQQLDRPITLLNAPDFSNADLKNYNVIIIPDGYYKFLESKDAADNLKRWIERGGKLIVMEGAAKQVAGLDWGIKLKKAPEEVVDSSSTYAYLKKYGSREREGITNNITGAIYKIQLDNTHPMGFGYPDFYYILKLNDNVYEFLKDGWNIGVIKKQKAISGFVGTKAKENLKDGTLIGELPMGRGSLIFFADDPLYRSFWEGGKMLFCNAVFFAGQ